MKILKVVFIVVILSSLLVACGQETTEVRPLPEPAEVKQPTNGGIVAGSIEPSLTLTSSVDGVSHFEYKLKNQTPNVVTLEYNSGLKYDYMIKSNDNKVFQHSENIMVTMMLETKELKQGEEVVYLIETPKLDSGKYTIEIWSTSKKEGAFFTNMEFEVK